MFGILWEFYFGCFKASEHNSAEEGQSLAEVGIEGGAGTAFAPAIIRTIAEATTAAIEGAATTASTVAATTTKSNREEEASAAVAVAKTTEETEHRHKIVKKCGPGLHIRRSILPSVSLRSKQKVCFRASQKRDTPSTPTPTAHPPSVRPSGTEFQALPGPGGAARAAQHPISQAVCPRERMHLSRSCGRRKKDSQPRERPQSSSVNRWFPKRNS